MANESQASESQPAHSLSLFDQLPQISPDSIVSRTLYTNEQVKVVLFGFAAGQELSEHTASVPAIVHILRGEGTLMLGEHTQPAGPGTWAHMPANLKHALTANTEMLMLLTMLKRGEARGT
jgi:quercetin dioxygenase-like cupin family protein